MEIRFNSAGSGSVMAGLALLKVRNQAIRYPSPAGSGSGDVCEALEALACLLEEMQQSVDALITASMRFVTVSTEKLETADRSAAEGFTGES